MNVKSLIDVLGDIDPAFDVAVRVADHDDQFAVKAASKPIESVSVEHVHGVVSLTAWLPAAND